MNISKKHTFYKQVKAMTLISLGQYTKILNSSLSRKKPHLLLSKLAKQLNPFYGHTEVLEMSWPCFRNANSKANFNNSSSLHVPIYQTG